MAGSFSRFDDSPFFTASEAAQYLRLEVKTLNNMRWRVEGPGWGKHGGKVVYHREALDHWSLQRGTDPNCKSINAN